MGENAIALAPGANDKVRPRQLDIQIEAATWASHDLLLQWELPPETTMRAAARARAAGSRVILNLAPARALAPLDLGLVEGCVVNRSSSTRWLATSAWVNQACQTSPHGSRSWLMAPSGCARSPARRIAHRQVRPGSGLALFS